MIFKSGCRHVKTLLWDLASGTLSKAECEYVETHVLDCEVCKRELDSYRNTISLIGEFKREIVPVSQLGWRDLECRVASQGSTAAGWAKRPAIQFAMGGGSLVLATVFVMFVMQANMNPTHISSPSGVEKLVAEQPGKKLDSKSESVDFPAEAGMLAVMAMPAVSDSSNIEARPTPAHDDRRLVHSNLRLATTRIITSSPQAPANDVNVDGGSPVQPLRPEYVMASASSGNDEDQNHRYVIDTVSNSRASSVSEGSEESHPW